MAFKIPHWFQRFSLTRSELKKSGLYRFFGDRIFHPDLWVFNAKSVARAWLISIFSAMSPFLGLHMVMAAAAAMFFRANLPLSAALVWVNNPVTLVFYYPFAYWFGCRILHLSILPHIHWRHALTEGWEAFFFLFVRIWKPLLLGCTILGIVFGLLGYLLILLLWPNRQKSKVLGVNS